MEDQHLMWMQCYSLFSVLKLFVALWRKPRGASTLKEMVQEQRYRFLWKMQKWLGTFRQKYLRREFAYAVFCDPAFIPNVAVLLLLVEAIVNVAVINRVKYTEIDWHAYMQEVEGVWNGTLDYTKLRGDTGPLVYPAGFVYVFSVLYWLTERGQNLRLAQYVFAILHLIVLALVFRLYARSKKVPPYALILACCTSYRIHSIFVLRLFNDPVAMLFLYGAVNLFLDGRWSMGSLLYSLAVSVKMNVLLFAPALFLAYLTSLGLLGTLKQLVICGGLQLVLGLPFLITNPMGYIQGAFNFGRVFLYEWTVNWRFLPEEIFVDWRFHIALLLLHALLLCVFFWPSLVLLKSYATLKQISGRVRQQLKGRTERVDMSTVSQLFLLPMFTSNLIGIACARSLHYQFYIWYFHQLPYLLWSAPFSNITRLCILGMIELCWNVYPSTSWSSAALHLEHIAMLVGIFVNLRQNVKQA